MWCGVLIFAVNGVVQNLVTFAAGDMSLMLLFDLVA
jgi:hypothetical protein